MVFDFYFARLFLKAIGESYKGDFYVETDRWIGRTFFAKVTHAEYKGKKYANIGEYNFDKPVEQYKPPINNNPGGITDPKDIKAITANMELLKTIIRQLNAELQQKADKPK